MTLILLYTYITVVIIPPESKPKKQLLMFLLDGKRN